VKRKQSNSRQFLSRWPTLGEWQGCHAYAKSAATEKATQKNYNYKDDDDAAHVVSLFY